jgi:hypothetical protein
MTDPVFTPKESNSTEKTYVVIHDPVNHPSHYTRGAVECIEAIKSALGDDGFIDYCSGNAIKYLFRWRHKNGLEDLKKAQFYLSEVIKMHGA